MSPTQDLESSRRRRTALSMSQPCLVFVRIFRRIVSVVCLLSGFFPDSVRTFRKYAVRSLSVHPDNDETGLSGLSMSFSADVRSPGPSQSDIGASFYIY